MTPLRLLLAGVLGAAGARALMRKKKPRRMITNPFSDKACTKLRTPKQVERWTKRVGLKRYQTAFKDNPVSADESLEEQVKKVHEYTRYALETLPGACVPMDFVPARRDLYKAMFCAISHDLIVSGRVDEELDELSAYCLDSTQHPLDPTDNQP